MTKAADPTFKNYFVDPTVAVAQQATLIYLMKSLPRLRKGLVIFLKKLISKDLIDDVLPSVLGTLVYRALRFTEFGKHHRNTSAFIAGLIFSSTTKLSTMKLLSSALASCWLFEVIKTWDELKYGGLSDDEKENPNNKHCSTWVFAANVFFTGITCGHMLAHYPTQGPGWFRVRTADLLGVSMVEQSRVENYRADYMLHCSGNFHLRESCIASILARFPRVYRKTIELGMAIQIPSLLLKRNLWNSLHKAHEFALYWTCVCGMAGASVCLGNAILAKPGLLRRVHRWYGPLLSSWLSTYITCRWILPNPHYNEYYGIWFGQVALFSLMAICGDWSYIVFGAWAINGLRRRIERSEKSKKSSKIAIGRLLESMCIGKPLRDNRVSFFWENTFWKRFRF